MDDLIRDFCSVITVSVCALSILVHRILNIFQTLIFENGKEENINGFSDFASQYIPSKCYEIEKRYG